MKARHGIIVAAAAAAAVVVAAVVGIKLLSPSPSTWVPPRFQSPPTSVAESRDLAEAPLARLLDGDRGGRSVLLQGADEGWLGKVLQPLDRQVR